VPGSAGGSCAGGEGRHPLRAEKGLSKRLRRERRRVAIRSTLIQSVWNYDSLQAIGFGWAILPGLERIRPDRRERADRLQAHLETFNANPYLAPIAMGVAIRMEEEIARGAAGAERRLAKLLGALRGSLGAIGDDLFWTAWRPALGLAAAMAALMSESVWPAVVYVLAWNALAQSVRVAGVRAGFATGAGVVRVLQDRFWAKAAGAARLGGSFAAGVGLGAGAAWAVLGGGQGKGAGIFFALVALLWLAGTRVGSRGRLLSPALAFLAVAALLGAIFHLSQGALP
jgi:mannose/fructose/N-acetylgalactosamine-specific phosphotransferase system component IID